MDPLSSVLSLLKPRSHLSGRFDIGRKQAILLPKYKGIKCYVVLAGTCWLTVPDAEQVLLRENDCFLLPSGRAFSLAADGAAHPVELQDLLTALYNGASGLYDGESACTLAGGHFLMDGDPADLLLGFLPAMVHLRAEHEKMAMRWSLERMREELRDKSWAALSGAAARLHDAGSSASCASGPILAGHRGLALRAYGSAAQVRHRVHASQSSEPLDGEWSGAARRHVTLDLCP